MIGALAKDKNLWTIATAPVAGDVLGETDYKLQIVPGGAFVAGGTPRIEGNAGKYARATQQTGVPITYRTILVHEAGHAVGSLLFQQFGPLAGCGKSCGL
jgi:hypothetical protein